MSKKEIKNAFIHLCYNSPFYLQNKSLLSSYLDGLHINVKKELLILLEMMKIKTPQIPEDTLIEYFGRGCYVVEIAQPVQFLAKTLYHLENDSLSFLNLNLLKTKQDYLLKRLNKNDIFNEIPKIKNSLKKCKKCFHKNMKIPLDFDFVAICFREILCNFEYVKQHEDFIEKEYKLISSKFELQFLKILVNVFKREDVKWKITLPVKTTDEIIEAKKWPPPNYLIDEEEEEEMDWWKKLGYPTIKVPYWARIKSTEKPKGIPYPPVSEYFME